MIVIIGGSSFIGTYLIDELVSKDREVFATGKNNLNEEYYTNKGVTWGEADIANVEDFKKLPGHNIEAVILLAGLMPANVKDYDPKSYIEINIAGTLNTLEYCRRVNANKIIFASSHSDVAGLWDCGRAITEKDRRTINYTGDHTVYIITKLAAMDLVEHYHQEHGIQGISFRLPAVYGYGPHTEIYIDGQPTVTGFKTFIKRAVASMPIEVWGDCRKGRDIVYVKDVVNAFIRAIDSDKAHGLYNIATGIRTTLEEEVKGIIEVFSPPNHASKIIYKPDKPSVHTYLYDISKAKHDFGYEVRYPYREMLEDYKIEMRSRRFPHLIEREKKL